MHKYLRCFLVFLFLLLISFQLTASNIPPELQPFIQKVEANFGKIKTIQGKIKRIMTVNKEEEKSEGFFAQEVPYKVQVEFTTAPRQQIVCNGREMWVYSLENKEVMYLDNLRLEELSTMQRFDFNYLLDEIVNSPFYNISIYKQDKANVIISAVPKNANPYVSLILIKVAKNTGIILTYETFTGKDSLTNQVMMENYRQYGDFFYPQKITVKSIVGPNQTMTMVTELFRLEFNQPIPASRFQFKPPAKVKVIDRKSMQEQMSKRHNSPAGK